jgi:hypothetical protein
MFLKRVSFEFREENYLNPFACEKHPSLSPHIHRFLVNRLSFTFLLIFYKLSCKIEQEVNQSSGFFIKIIDTQAKRGIWVEFP